jgi:S1-C subfamily serine protease
MDDFGVQAPELKAVARTPTLPSGAEVSHVTLDATRSRTVVTWAGAKVRNIVGLDEVSAAGTPGETGVIVLDVPPVSAAEEAGISAGDVILAFDNKPVKDTLDLMRFTQMAASKHQASITILRFQQESTVKVSLD